VDGTTFKRLFRTWKASLRDRKIGVHGKPREKTNKWLARAEREHHYEKSIEAYLRVVEEQTKLLEAAEEAAKASVVESMRPTLEAVAAIQKARAPAGTRAKGKAAKR